MMTPGRGEGFACRESSGFSIRIQSLPFDRTHGVFIVDQTTFTAPSEDVTWDTAFAVYEKVNVVH